MGFIIDGIANVTVGVYSVTGGTETTITTSTDHNYNFGDGVNINISGADPIFAVINTSTNAKVTSVINSTTFKIDTNTSAYPGTFYPINSFTNRDEFYRDNFIAVDLVEIQLKNSLGADNTLYLAGGGFNLDWASPTAPNAWTNTYQCQGNFMGFSTMTQDFDVKVGKFTVYLSGVGNDYLNKFTAYNPEGQRVTIYKAFLEFTVVNNVEVLQIVPNPLMIFDGIIYNIIVTEGKSSCQINVECSSLFADYDRTQGRMTNNGSNWLFQGNQYDTSMEQAGFVGETNFLWGKL